MPYSRRHTLGLGATAIAGLGLGGLLVPAGRALGQTLEGDDYTSDAGTIVIRPVEHASLVMSVPGMVIYADPVGGAALYEGLPPPALILVTHEHGDHFDVETLAALVGDNTRLLTNPAVHGMLPEDLKARATAIANGETTTANDIPIAAVPAYNTTADRLQYHPQGRDNGYVLTVAGQRVYIAGDTEDIPEMRALEAIDIAFVPMNLPYTMTVEQAAAGVEAFQPGFVYPYHYGESDTAEFARLVTESGARTDVVLHDWYPNR
jgi:L-ascorbate metabolism protein UlaG (beta-lactamase superfamily)